MREKPIIFFMLFVTLFFTLPCACSFLEARDVEDPAVENGDTLAGGFFSVTLISPLPNFLFDCLPTFFSPNTVFVTNLSVLRC
jgi:hypothetical protein